MTLSVFFGIFENFLRMNYVYIYMYIAQFKEIPKNEITEKCFFLRISNSLEMY